jgi:hypothetical protein
MRAIVFTFRRCLPNRIKPTAYVHVGLQLLAKVRVGQSNPLSHVRRGQYLAFIYAYSTLHRRRTAETGFPAFFRGTPPTVHRMVVTLHERGLVARVPGQPRSTTLLVPPEQLPPLQSIETAATRY